MAGSKHGVGILAQILAVAVWCSVASPPSLDLALDARGRSSCICSSTERWGWQEERRDSPSSGLGWTGRIDDGGEGMMASHQRDVGSCGLVACLRGFQCRRGSEEEEARVTSDAHSCSPPPHPHHPPRPSLILRGGSDTAEGGPKLYSPRMKQKAVIEHFLGRMQAPLPLPEGDDGRGDGDAQRGGEATRPDEPWKAVRYDSHWRDVLAMCIPPSELTMHGTRFKCPPGLLHSSSHSFMYSPTHPHADYHAQMDTHEHTHTLDHSLAHSFAFVTLSVLFFSPPSPCFFFLSSLPSSLAL
jgi:hypothetical protein